MPKGTFSPSTKVITLIAGYALGAVLADQVLVKVVMPCDGRIGGVQADADTAGAGAGSTVLDVTVAGTSIYASTALKPTLLGTSTGNFDSGRPDNRALKVGDEIVLKVSGVPAGSGHGQLAFTVAIERP